MRRALDELNLQEVVCNLDVVKARALKQKDCDTILTAILKEFESKVFKRKDPDPWQEALYVDKSRTMTPDGQAEVPTPYSPGSTYDNGTNGSRRASCRAPRRDSLGPPGYKTQPIPDWSETADACSLDPSTSMDLRTNSLPGLKAATRPLPGLKLDTPESDSCRSPYGDWTLRQSSFDRASFGKLERRESFGPPGYKVGNRQSTDDNSPCESLSLSPSHDKSQRRGSVYRTHSDSIKLSRLSGVSTARASGVSSLVATISLPSSSSCHTPEVHTPSTPSTKVRRSSLGPAGYKVDIVVDNPAPTPPQSIPTPPSANPLRTVSFKLPLEADEQPQDELAALTGEANRLRDAGKYDDALVMYRRALAKGEDLHGPEHPALLPCLNELAALLCNQGKFDEAVFLFRQSLGIQERELGEEHPDVMTSTNDLAALLRDQNKYGDAVVLFRKSLHIREKRLGEDNPQVASDIINLALLLRDNEQHDAALPLFRRALEITERTMGRYHPDVAIGLGNLGMLLEAQGKLEDALPLYGRALAIREQVYGDQHPSTMRTRRTMDNLRRKIYA